MGLALNPVTGKLDLIGEGGLQAGGGGGEAPTWPNAPMLCNRLIGGGDGPNIYQVDVGDGLILEDNILSVSFQSQQETINFHNRIIDLGGYIDSQTLAAIDAFIVRGKSAGWWSLLVEVWPFVGRKLTSSLQKLKYSAASAITNYNLVEGDYTQEDGMGPLTGATGTYLDPNFTPSSAGIAKATLHFGISMCCVDIAGLGGYAFSDNHSGSADDHALFAYQNSGSFGTQGNYWSFNNWLPRVVALNVASGVKKQWVDGFKFVDYTANLAGSELTAPITMFRSKRYGTVEWGAGKFGMVVIGTGMTESMAADCHAAMMAFEKAVGRKAFQGENVVTIGDSITAGQVSSDYKYDTWASRVAWSIGKRLTNLGVSSMYLRVDGATSVGVYPQRSQYAALEGRDVILAIGTNDIAAEPNKLNASPPYTNSADFQAKLTTTIQALINVGKRVTVVGPFYRDATVGTEGCCRAYQAAAAAAAAATTPPVAFVDGDRIFRDLSSPGSYMGDTVHPNSIGHNRIESFVTAMVMRKETIREPSIDFASINAGATGTVDVEVLNCSTTNSVVLEGCGDTLPVGLRLSARVSATNTVTITAENTTSSTIDASAFRVRIVIKK